MTKITREAVYMSRNIDDKEAKEEILFYLKGKHTCYISDIAYDLNIDYDQVGRILNSLMVNGIVMLHSNEIK